MRIFILLIILLITVSNCGPINIGNKKIDIKKNEIEGYYIEFYAKRGKYGKICNVYLTVINKNSNINELYIEIQAIDKDKKIISVANFLIKQAKKNEIINKMSTFSKLIVVEKLKI